VYNKILLSKPKFLRRASYLRIKGAVFGHKWSKFLTFVRNLTFFMPFPVQNIAQIVKYTLFVAIFTLTACDGDKSRFTTLDSQVHSLEDWYGHWLLVNFWAEWCQPCRSEVPQLNRLEASGHVKVLGFSFDPISNAKISAIKQSWGINYSLVATKPEPIVPFSLPKGLPTSYLYSPSGELLKVIEGEVDADELLKQIKILQKND